MPVGQCMTSGFNSHLSCTPKWSKSFKMNAAGQQIFSEAVLGSSFYEWYKCFGRERIKVKDLFAGLLPFRLQPVSHVCCTAQSVCCV